MNKPLEQELESLIVSFEDGRLSFDEFSRTFSDTYLDRAEELADTETARMLDAIHERLEWTTASPPDEDRQYGWGDPSDFRKWLASARGRA